MFQLWGKEFKDNRLLKDIVIEEDGPVKIPDSQGFSRSHRNLYGL